MFVNELRTIAQDIHLFKKIRIPSKAVNYKFFSGTGKKGDFEIYSLFDKDGNLLKRISTYLKNNEETKIVTKYVSKQERKTVRLINGKIESFTREEMRWGDKYKSLWTENTMFRNSGADIQKISLFESGHKPKSLCWRSSWNGQAPEIEYQNMDKIPFTTKERSYLPPLTDTKNFRRFRHMAETQLNEQGIKNVYDEFHVITPNQVSDISKEVADYERALGVSGVFADETGKIYVVLKKDISVADEAGTIAHEIQHAKDHADIARLEDTVKTPKNSAYYDKARKLGIIKKNEQPKEYNRLSELKSSIERENYYKECMSGNHDELLIERYAIDKENKEGDFCSTAWWKIMKAFKFW